MSDMTKIASVASIACGIRSLASDLESDAIPIAAWLKHLAVVLRKPPMPADRLVVLIARHVDRLEEAHSKLIDDVAGNLS